MIPTPITKALFSMKRNGVHSLLMGGQACVCYGAAEFSRDFDLAIKIDQRNLANLEGALAELEAHYLTNSESPGTEQVRFWLKESFDLTFPARLIERFPSPSRPMAEIRPVIQHLLEGDQERARSALQFERRTIEIADETYWAPLTKELHQLRSLRSSL